MAIPLEPPICEGVFKILDIEAPKPRFWKSPDQLLLAGTMENDQAAGQIWEDIWTSNLMNFKNAGGSRMLEIEAPRLTPEMQNFVGRVSQIKNEQCSASRWRPHIKTCCKCIQKIPRVQNRAPKAPICQNVLQTLDTGVPKPRCWSNPDQLLLADTIESGRPAAQI